MKKKTIYGNQQKKTDIDCSVCKRRRRCESQAEGKFCDSFRSETFNPEEQNPMKTWEKENQKRRRSEMGLNYSGFPNNSMRKVGEVE
jgi:hypothetical protein